MQKFVFTVGFKVLQDREPLFILFLLLAKNIVFLYNAYKHELLSQLAGFITEHTKLSKLT